jgi:hypothetical protein
MRSAIKAVGIAFIATRIALMAISALAVLRLPVNATEAQGFHLPRQPHTVLEGWARYDACWYVAIAEHGYVGSIGPWGDMRSDFMPLFPALIALVSPFVRIPLLAGLIVSNVCLFVFLSVLWRLIELDWGTDVARRTILIYLLFPSAFFLSGAYSESALLAATTGAVFAARREHWQTAGWLAALAILTRPVGIGATALVLAEYVRTRRQMSSERYPSPALIILPVLAAAAGYMLFSALTFGDSFSLVHSQISIRGPLAPPWEPFVEFWGATPRLHGFNNSILDLALAIAAVIALPIIYSRSRPSYALYAALIVLIPLSESLISFNRLLLPSFPHATMLATVMTKRWSFIAMLISFACLQAVALSAFATWNWVA